MIRREADRCVIEGPVTLGTVAGLLEQGVRVFGADRVVVDFSRVTEADSAALSLMLEWARRLPGKIGYANLSTNLKSLADLYGVAGLIPLADA